MVLSLKISFQRTTSVALVLEDSREFPDDLLVPFFLHNETLFGD
jgi:hypothetical protein